MLQADILNGSSYWPADHPVLKFLTIFPAIFSDTYDGKLATT